MHEYEIRCGCGNRWRLEARDEPELVECVACGGDAREVHDLGEIRGR